MFGPCFVCLFVGSNVRVCVVCVVSTRSLYVVYWPFVCELLLGLARGFASMNLCGLDLACFVESSFDIYYGVAVGGWGPWARCLNHCLSISVGGAFVGVHREVSSNWCVAGIWCCFLSVDRHMDFCSRSSATFIRVHQMVHVMCIALFLVRLFKVCI